MTNPYYDPHFEPSADISGAEARAYEEAIVILLREALLPSSGRITLDSIEMRGERPDTEIVLRYTDVADQKPAAVRIALWKSGYPTDGAAEFGKLHEPVSVAGWIASAWSADELEPVEPK